MAGWDAYIDNLISHSKGNCDKVAIIGLNGAYWTSQTGDKALVLDATEASTVSSALSSDNEEVFQVNGIKAGGIKYQFLRRDENTYYGKKKDNGCITLQKAKTCFIAAHTKEGGQVGDVNKAVNIICEYLEGSGM